MVLEEQDKLLLNSSATRGNAVESPDNVGRPTKEPRDEAVPDHSTKPVYHSDPDYEPQPWSPKTRSR